MKAYNTPTTMNEQTKEYFRNVYRTYENICEQADEYLARLRYELQQYHNNASKGGAQRRRNMEMYKECGTTRKKSVNKHLRSHEIHPKSHGGVTRPTRWYANGMPWARAATKCLPNCKSCTNMPRRNSARQKGDASCARSSTDGAGK